MKQQSDAATARPDTPGPIAVRGLRFRYPAETERARGTAAPNAIELQIPHLDLPAGKIAVLIGDNGCGKTTLLKLLAGILRPLEGTVVAPERPVLVHQRPYLFAQSVLANVMWPLRIRRIPRPEARRRAEAAIAQVGLSALARRWAPFLSGGEKQRVAIARALVIRPSVLLLDEPTSNIDAVSVRAIERVLAETAASGTAVVMSTHNIASAYRIANRLLPMDAGRLTPVTVNIFRGQMVREADGAHPDHIGCFGVADGPRIFCPTSAEPCTTAVVRMDDVILSQEAITTSAQNRFRGTVAAVEEVGHELSRVEIDIGVPIAALVTHRSVDDLSIRPGAAMHVTFKASAVALF